MTEFASSIFNRIQGLVESTAQGFLPNPFAPTQFGAAQPMVVPVNIFNLQDRKVVEKCYKGMEQVLKLCHQPSLNLKNSPPFIPDILPDIYTLLQQIFAANGGVLDDNLYLRLFISNLTLKCKQTIRLFKDSKEKIFALGSTARRSLNMKSLIFSHMLSELKAEFPEDGRFIGTRYRITKRQAADFWVHSFGDRTIVSWEDFRTEFTRIHHIGIGIETHALKNTIDLTCNDHISNFEFDVFTRLFHPWDTLLKNWQILAVTHPAYMAFMTYDDVRNRLQQFVGKPGSYVYRLSCTRLGEWAIGYVGGGGKIYQTIPDKKSLIQALVEGSRDFYLYPNGRATNPDLSQLLSLSSRAAATQTKVQVTDEQYQIYCEMGTTFEICKICDERNKNIKLEPCEHLLCKICLEQWQKSPDGDRSCPFCRCEIKGTAPVTIHPPDKGSGSHHGRGQGQPRSNLNGPQKSVDLIHFDDDVEKQKETGEEQPINSRSAAIEIAHSSTSSSSSKPLVVDLSTQVVKKQTPPPGIAPPPIPPRSTIPNKPPQHFLRSTKICSGSADGAGIAPDPAKNPTVSSSSTSNPRRRSVALDGVDSSGGGAGPSGDLLHFDLLGGGSSEAGGGVTMESREGSQDLFNDFICMDFPERSRSISSKESPLDYRLT